MSVCCECCVLSGRGLCDGLITRPEESYGCLSVVSAVCCQVKVSATGLITRLEESYRLWCVSECDLENLKNEEVIAREWAARAIKKY